MINWTALIVFLLLFGLVTWMGFIAAHWRKGDLDLLHEWGLGGRRFGTIVTWFLIGGDLYTAYTFVAVPALLFGAGAIGFFAVPYTIMVYPILYIVFPRLWSVARKHGYITSADFVRGRFGNRWLALAIALTGILATMPYIALQLVGIQVVLGALGIETGGLSGDLPLIIAFVILAAFTYTSGLRAPAMIAIVKDVLIYVTVIAAIIVVPLHLGGYDKVFSPIPAAKLLLAPPPAGSLGSFSAYATLALGSALALFLYPHSITGVLSSSSARVVRRNAAALPAYSVMLGLLALVGFMAIAVGVQSMPEFAGGFKRYGNNFSVPALFLAMFPSWFVGVAFAAIAIGALVPAAIMSIATANTFTRNIYREFIHQDCTNAEEARMAKIVSLVIKAGALAVHHLRAAAVRDLPAIARRCVDHPDAAFGDPWPVHTNAERLGAADRLGERVLSRHLDGRVNEFRAGVSAEDTRHDSALLHRASRSGGEPCRGGGAVGGIQPGALRPPPRRDGGQRLRLALQL